MLLRKRILVVVPSLALAFLVPEVSSGQQFRTGSAVSPAGSGTTGTPFGAFNLGGNLNNVSGPATAGLGRAQNSLPNPVNYWQYSQITGTGPSIGTVATYNQFGLAGMAFGGALNGQTGMATQGSPPPPGVNLSVNNAQMMYPNQMQINNLGFNYPLNPYSMYGYPGLGYPGLGYASPYGYPGIGGYGYPGLYGTYSGLFGGLGATGVPLGQNAVQNPNAKAAGN